MAEGLNNLGRYMDVSEAARYLGLSTAYLNLARHKGTGPPFIRPEGLRKILYDRLALDEWMAAGTRRATSEYDPAEAHRHRQSPGRPHKVASSTRKSGKRKPQPVIT